MVGPDLHTRVWSTNMASGGTLMLRGLVPLSVTSVGRPGSRIIDIGAKKVNDCRPLSVK